MYTECAGGSTPGAQCLTDRPTHTLTRASLSTVRLSTTRHLHPDDGGTASRPHRRRPALSLLFHVKHPARPSLAWEPHSDVGRSSDLGLHDHSVDPTALPPGARCGVAPASIHVKRHSFARSRSPEAASLCVRSPCARPPTASVAAEVEPVPRTSTWCSFP